MAGRKWSFLLRSDGYNGSLMHRADFGCVFAAIKGEDSVALKLAHVAVWASNKIGLTHSKAVGHPARQKMLAIFACSSYGCRGTGGADGFLT